MDNLIPQPKKFNSKKYQEGYDSIDWGRNKGKLVAVCPYETYIDCDECGQSHKLANKDDTMKFENNKWICKNCNFN